MGTTKSSNERSRIMLGDGTLRHRGEGLRVICAVGSEYPGIPLTRCVGNLAAQKLGVLGLPEITDRALDFGKEPAKFVILASDGIWDVLDEQEVVSMIYTAKVENLQYGIDHVLQLARTKWEQRTDVKGVVDDM